MVPTNFLLILGVCLTAGLISAVPLSSLHSEVHTLTHEELSHYVGTVNKGEVPDFEIVNPWPIRRKGRSVNDVDVQELEYIFTAFEEEFHLILEPAYDLYTDSLLIQNSWRNGSTLRPASKHCYYQGTSLYHNGSTTFASTCFGGVAATIRTEQAEYRVQPLREDHALRYTVDQNEPPAHIIHRLGKTASECAMEDEKAERQKRDVQNRGGAYETKYVEILVVADETVKQEYGGDTEFYILSMLNQVAGLYKDKTIGADIKLHISKIRILEEAMPEMEISDNIETSLQQFCAWQRGESADVSVLISRRDLAFGDHRDVTGNSFDIGTACDANRRCSIAEDHGPNGLVFTVAHEIAHLLGVYHDGQMNGCEDEGFIMSSTDSGGKDAFKWSECSRINLLDWLKSDSSSCLDNVPPASSKYFLSSVPLPGHFYDADFQCRSLHNDDTATVSQTSKDTDDICNELSCDYGTFSAVSNHIPPLDGTSCGHQKACITGWCMDLASKLDCGGGDCPPTYISGTWTTCDAQCVQNRQVLCAEVHDDGSTVILDYSACSALTPVADQRCCCKTGICSVVAGAEERYQWIASSWSSCSATCGTAQQTRIVTCYDSVANLPTEVETLCNADLRPAGLQDCSLPDCPVPSNYIWLIGAYGPCSVTCGGGTQVQGLACYDSTLNTLVNNDVCTANLGEAPELQTRECNIQSCGPSNTYQFVVGAFGACSVTCGDGVQTRSVTCVDLSNNNVPVDGTNCINQGLTEPSTVQACNLGNCPVTVIYEFYTSEYQACTVTCGDGVQIRTVYCREVGTTAPVSDSLCTQQGLEKPGNVQFCSLGACPSTTYQFVSESWSECSVTCGDGFQTRPVYCVQVGSTTQVSDSLCTQQGLTKPSDVQSCSLQACPTTVYQFVPGSWSECSVTCGRGYQFRDVDCRETASGEIVSDTLCVTQGLVKPAPLQVCDLEPCAYEYYTGNWQQCTVTCGGGTQSRVVYCTAISSGGATSVADSLCIQQGLVKPSEVQSCNTQSCPVVETYTYFAGNWGECSVTCGNGVQTRQAVCFRLSDSQIVADSFCEVAGNQRPVTSQLCQLNACPVGTYEYYTGPFGACSEPCGTGVQTRTVYCVRVGETTQVAQSLCIGQGLVQPDTAQACNTDPCTSYAFDVGTWGQCSSTCGSGTQTRNVICIDTVSGAAVDMSICINAGLQMPGTVQQCPDLSPCPVYDFVTGQWGECSSTCDSGNQTRTVTCVDSVTSTEVDMALCMNESLQMPNTVQECPDLSPCPVYDFVPEEWGSCSATCGEGIRFRSVLCVDQANANQVVDNSLCVAAGLVAPDAQEACNIQSCEGGDVYLFITSSWGDCECSTSLQRRLVRCFRITVTQLFAADDAACEALNQIKPDDTQACIPDSSCGVWRTAEWDECSVTCGVGTQRRSVFCVAANNQFTILPEELCPAERPAVVQECDTGVQCEKAHYWLTEPWSECSTTCGDGVRTRETSCYTLNGVIRQVDNSFCDAAEEPDKTETCNLRPCQGVWVAHPWTLCSVTCGGGTQTREIDCRLAKDATESVDVSSCVEEDSPPVERECNDGPCPSPYNCGNTFFTETGTILSPQFPGYYPPDVECLNTITLRPEERVQLGDDTQHFEIEFSEFYLEEAADCRYDYVEIIDVLTNTHEKLCGDLDELPYTYVSQGDHVEVNFVSDATVANAGFLATWRRVADAVPSYRAGDWSECSAVCGEGEQRRPVTCILRGLAVPAAECERLALERPADRQPCPETPTCPPYTDVCDDLILTTGSQIYSPGYPANYAPDSDCTTHIRNPDGCVRITFTDLAIMGGPGCSDDFVEVNDEIVPSLTRRYCGTPREMPVWQSLNDNTTVTVTFHSNAEQENRGFSADVEFIDCVQYVWVTGPWTPCYLPCGNATRSRTVECINTATNQVVDGLLCPSEVPDDEEECRLPPCSDCNEVITEPDVFIRSPNFPNLYPNNDLCRISITNPNPEGCVRLIFLNFDVQGGREEGVCDTDKLEILDVGNEDSGFIPLCGSRLPPSYKSAMSMLFMTFETDQDVAGRGYEMYVKFEACSTMEYTVGDWSDCDAACDGGTRYRDVACVDTSTGQEVPLDMCPGPRPPNSEPCNLQPCEPIECNAEIMTSGGLFQTPNYPVSYPASQDCYVNVTNDRGCIRVAFLSQFDVQPGTVEGVCDNDYVQIMDNTDDELTVSYCGNEIPDPWESASGSVSLNFHSNDDANVGAGVWAYFTFFPCPDHHWVIGNWSECDTACDEGTRYRDVSCVQTSTGEDVPLDMCPGPTPPNSEPCNLQPCEPIECSAVITTSGGLFQTPNYPVSYPASQDCYVNVTNDRGCIRVAFLSQFDVQPGNVEGVCDNDYVQIVDNTDDELTVSYCGNEIPDPWDSTSGSVSLNFHSNDDADVGGGVWAYFTFFPCPDHHWVIGNWSECDTACDGGTRYRDVSCVQTSTGEDVPLDMCPGPTPPNSEPCNLQPCEPIECSAVITTSGGLFQTPNYPVSYPASQDCYVNVTNDRGCIRVAFLSQFDVQPGTVEDVCDNDYVQIVDNTDDELTVSYCGNEIPDPWDSTSGSVSLNFHSNDDADVGGGVWAYFTFFPCPDYRWVAGNWSECDATCDGGVRVRTVVCLEGASGDTVEDSLCPPAGRPVETEPCNEEPCPEIDCDKTITESGQTFQSPGYPNAYDNNQLCFTNVTNDLACVRVAFLSAFDVESGTSADVCDNDYVEIVDTNNGALTTRVCGNTIPDPWLSTSGHVEVTFHSNDAGVGSGFLAYVTFNPCPEYAWVAGEWSECDATCEGGVRTRTVTCQNTDSQVADSLCPAGEKPAESEPCNEQPCPPPSCDKEVTVGNSLYGYDVDEYINSRHCEMTITNSDGCIILTFARFDIEPGTTSGICDNDYLEIDDLGSEDPPLRLCGSQNPPNFQSVSGNVVLRFHTNEAVTRTGFQVFPIFTTCPLYLWNVEPWGECDATCEGGTRTRTVTCQQSDTQQTVADDLCAAQKPAESEACNEQPCPGCDRTTTEPSFITSPNHPNNYDNNLDCTTTINGQSDLCVRISFIELSIQAGSAVDVCDRDYVQITDLDNPSLTDTMCGSQARTFNSLSPNVQVVFHSDDSITDTGFQLYATFVTCPQYTFATGEWGECDVTCGGGTRTRTVECRRTSDDAVVSDTNCVGQRPPAAEPCNVEECPACQEDFTEGGLTIGSANYPNAYPPNQDCVYTITNPDGCVRLTFLAFNLEAGTAPGVCDADYVRVEDDNNPSLTETYCGGVLPPNWLSSSGSVTITFHSNGAVQGSGFYIFERFADCPVYNWVPSPWGECSVTCGDGVQTRTVECRNSQTNLAVVDSLCTSAMPPESQACNEQACAIDCDATITDRLLISSYGFPSNYENNLDCVTTVINTEGCINIVFLDFDVEAGSVAGVCDNDYLQIEDVSGGQSETYCGLYSPLPSFNSVTGNVRMTFHSNGAVTRPGYRVFADFAACPQFDWSPSEWGTCSVTCNGGLQTRTVVCLNVQTGAPAASDALCTRTKPAESQACNSQACQQYCDRILTNAGGLLSSPNYGNNYDNNENCLNTIVNAGGCVRLAFAAMDIQEGTSQGVCDRDYLEIIDASDSSSTRYCGYTVPSEAWLSKGTTVNVLFVSDGSVTATGFNLVYTFESCPTYTWAFTAWSTCTVTCEGGTQTRAVYCQDESGIIVSDSLCPAGGKPSETQICNEGACPTRYAWQSQILQVCSVTCGGGFELLFVYCQDLQSSQTVADGLCQGAKPPSSRACNIAACPADGVPTCGDRVTEPTGTIQSPGYPVQYPNNVDCVITFEVPADTRIKFTINVFSLETDTSIRCERDYVKFEPLPSSNTALYCKQYILPLIWESTSGDTEVRVQFYSDGSGTQVGYSATWEHV